MMMIRFFDVNACVSKKAASLCHGRQLRVLDPAANAKLSSMMFGCWHYQTLCVCEVRKKEATVQTNTFLLLWPWSVVVVYNKAIVDKATRWKRFQCRCNFTEIAVLPRGRATYVRFVLRAFIFLPTFVYSKNFENITHPAWYVVLRTTEYSSTCTVLHLNSTLIYISSPSLQVCNTNRYCTR